MDMKQGYVKLGNVLFIFFFSKHTGINHIIACLLHRDITGCSSDSSDVLANVARW